MKKFLNHTWPYILVALGWLLMLLISNHFFLGGYSDIVYSLALAVASLIFIIYMVAGLNFAKNTAEKILYSVSLFISTILFIIFIINILIRIIIWITS